MLFSSNKSYLWVTTLLVVIPFFVLFQGSQTAETYEAKCDSAPDPNNAGRTVDNCDSEKFLKCYDGRCRCADQTNQIWTYKHVKASSSSRSRRSPKGGKGGSSKGSGKKIAAGVAVGAAGGYIASNIAHNSGSSVGSGFGNRGSSSSKKESTVRVYACYSRVQGSCFLPNQEHQQFIPVIAPVAGSTSTSTSTPSSTVVPGASNTTAENKTGETTTPAPATTTAAAGGPQALAQTSYVTEFLRIPKCVENAQCTKPEVKIVNGTLVSGSSKDPRLGACSCESGYKANNQDLCVKSGAGIPEMSSFTVIMLASLLTISKLF